MNTISAKTLNCAAVGLGVLIAQTEGEILILRKTGNHARADEVSLELRDYEEARLQVIASVVEVTYG